MSTYTPGRLKVNPLQLDQICTEDAKTCVAFVSTNRKSADMVIANAERLALCWNTHDQLVEALQVAHTRMARLASILDAQRPGGVIWKDEIDQVVAALAAAKVTP